MKFVYFRELKIQLTTNVTKPTKSRHIAISSCGDHAKLSVIFTSFQAWTQQVDCYTDLIQVNCYVLWLKISSKFFEFIRSINRQWSADVFKLGVILSSLWNLIHALFWLKMLLWSICKRMRLVFSFGLLDVWLVWWWLKARTFWRYCYHFFFLMYKTRKEADCSCFLRKKSSKEVGNKQRGNNML